MCTPKPTNDLALKAIFDCASFATHACKLAAAWQRLKVGYSCVCSSLLSWPWNDMKQTCTWQKAGVAHAMVTSVYRMPYETCWGWWAHWQSVVTILPCFLLDCKLRHS